MLFHLSIAFILIFNGQVGFLTNAFVDGRLICNDGEQTYVATKDGQWTYHTFNLPEGDNWDCNIMASGSGYVFPSERDFVIKNIVL